MIVTCLAPLRLVQPCGRFKNWSGPRWSNIQDAPKWFPAEEKSPLFRTVSPSFLVLTEYFSHDSLGFIFPFLVEPRRWGDSLVLTPKTSLFHPRLLPDVHQKLLVRSFFPSLAFDGSIHYAPSSRPHSRISKFRYSPGVVNWRSNESPLRPHDSIRNASPPKPRLILSLPPVTFVWAPRTRDLRRRF